MPRYLVTIVNVEESGRRTRPSHNPNLAKSFLVTVRCRSHAVQYAARLYANHHHTLSIEQQSVVDAIMEGYDYCVASGHENESDPLVFSDADDGHSLRIMVVRHDTDVVEGVDIHG